MMQNGRCQAHTREVCQAPTFSRMHHDTRGVLPSYSIVHAPTWWFLVLADSGSCRQPQVARGSGDTGYYCWPVATIGTAARRSTLPAPSSVHPALGSLAKPGGAVLEELWGDPDKEAQVSHAQMSRMDHLPSPDGPSKHSLAGPCHLAVQAVLTAPQLEARKMRRSDGRRRAPSTSKCVPCISSNPGPRHPT